MEAHDRSVLEAIGPLRDAGFALHWLHPRKKSPVGEGWQDAPVAGVEQLQASHRPGYNLGVRLGDPSALQGGGFLHGFDLDIRVPELAGEAWAAFRNLFPAVDPESLPCVASGSGGESRHLYFASDKAFRSKRLAVSEGKHRRHDKATGRDVWSYDWEIEIFGTGKQVAMPPSIHPDSGQPYRWIRHFPVALLPLGLGPFIPSAAIEVLAVAHHETFAFEGREPLTFKPGQMEEELDLIPVSELHYDDWIRLGQAIHHQTGGTPAGLELWLQHTRRSTKYDRDDRTIGRKWRSFGRYRGEPVTMGTIRHWVIEARRQRTIAMFDEEPGDAFDDQPAPAPATATDIAALLGDTPSPARAPVDPIDLLGGDGLDEIEPIDLLSSSPSSATLDWLSLLHINEEGAIKPTLHNLRLIVENDIWTRELVAYNEFTQEIVQRGVPGIKPPRRRNQAKPTLQLSPQNFAIRDEVNGDYWTEDKDNAIRALLEAPETQGGYGIKVPDRDLKAAIDIAGRRRAFHPVREYLERLTWDGTPRLARLFVDYLGAPDDAYHRQVAEIMLTAAVTRVYEPGHKYDTAVILEGLQGKRKSTFISVLARGWFAELEGEFTDAKLMVETMQGALVLEIPELSGFAKADVRHIKAFISRQSDKVRLAYAKRAQEYRRQSILIGSTNDDVYLKDSTGGRRFLPVKCQVDQIDTEALAEQIDQIWAEALHSYRAMRRVQPRGTLPLYLTNGEAQKTAATLQESRKVESTEAALAGRIAEWLDRPINNGGFDDDPSGEPRFRIETCLLEIWCECLGRDEAQYVGAWPSTLGRAMRMVPNWLESNRKPRFPKYGQQRAFEREDRSALALLG
jgi:predicted P-loop ATPase